MRRRLRRGGDAALLLPDTWPGPFRREENDDDGVLVPGRAGYDAWPGGRVTLIGRDPFAVAGMRHLLAGSACVWLRTLTRIPGVAELDDQDVVIWLRTRHDGMPELAGHVARLRRRGRGLKQLVISDALPGGVPPGPGPLSGVWLARGQECREMLSALLRQMMLAPPPTGPLLTRRLGRAQWRVLLMRAAGVDTPSIARACGTSAKTVSVHESALRERLGISGRAEYAWLLRSVAQMQRAVPALGRGLECPPARKAHREVI